MASHQASEDSLRAVCLSAPVKIKYEHCLQHCTSTHNANTHNNDVRMLLFRISDSQPPWCRGSWAPADRAPVAPLEIGASVSGLWCGWSGPSPAWWGCPDLQSTQRRSDQAFLFRICISHYIKYISNFSQQCTILIRNSFILSFFVGFSCRHYVSYCSYQYYSRSCEVLCTVFKQLSVWCGNIVNIIFVCANQRNKPPLALQNETSYIIYLFTLSSLLLKESEAGNVEFFLNK